MEFAGRSVVITGVGREGQVGEAIAAAFAERGARVFLVDREEAQARARAESLVTAGKRAAALGADLTNEAAVGALAERVRDATGGRVHALVHLAGGFAKSGTVAESELSVWHNQFAINATTAFLVSRAMMPLLRAAKGAAVFFASAAVLPGGKPAELSAYSASKSALLGLMHSIADEERASGVRANAVAPTSIRTASNVAAMGTDVRYVSREDVASVVLWLCSEEARVITGQVIPIS